MRDSIPPVERLVITLRYLATGQSLASLQFAFLIGKSTASMVVRETCADIWNVLHPIVMAKPQKEDWLEIAEHFYKSCNFPNCLGAIDGKHIRIKKPAGSGSQFFNYKKYFSFVLLAVCDSNYRFRYIDVGSYGSSSDSAVLGHSAFGRMLLNNELDLPPPQTLPGTTSPPMPFVFVGDEAFALMEHLMRPYSSRGLSIARRVFNYRLTRARQVVECSFGILVNKWRFLHTPIHLQLDTAIAAVKAACVLHNFVRERDGFNFEDSLSHCLESTHPCGVRGSTHSAAVREHLTAFFMSPHGELPWQLEAI